MAMNERVEYISGDITAGQLAPSQSGRTQFYPGKAVSRPGDMNFEKDYRIPTGTPAFDGESAGPVEIKRIRVVKLGRNIISDQTIPSPVVLKTRVESRQEVGVCGTNTTIDTENPKNITDLEKTSGSDNIVGA